MSETVSRLVSVVSPLFNERRNFATLLERLDRVAAGESGYAWEFIFVDDGSSDGTADLVAEAAGRDRRVKLVQLTRNFGHQVAITAGLDESRGDAVVSLDGDLQHPPELIPQFLRRWESGSDVVLGVRNSSTVGRFKRWTSSRFYWLINKLSEVPIPADVADFRLMSRSAVNAFLRMPERARFIRGLVSWMGFDVAVVGYDEGRRLSGATKYSLTRMMYFATDAITSFSALPLRIATVVGLLVSVGALVYTVYIFGVLLFRPGVVVPGWSSIILVVLWMGGLQLLFLGVIGEYLHRVFDEVKRRPLYLVKRRVGFDR